MANATRQLVALMFSDIAGYTAIMGRDERQGLQFVHEHRELVRSLVPAFGGKVVGDVGDGTLCSFASAVEAVNCAQAIQSRLRDNPDLRLRIGIHLGDVVY